MKKPHLCKPAQVPFNLIDSCVSDCTVPLCQSLYNAPQSAMATSTLGVPSTEAASLSAVQFSSRHAKSECVHAY